MVDQPDEILPTSRDLGEPLERVGQGRVAWVGQHCITRSRKRPLGTPNVVLPDLGSLREQSDPIRVGASELDPPLVEAHHLFELSGAPIVLLE